MAFPEPARVSSPLPSSPLKIHFIHVGYGDATLMQLPDGGNILVDTGKPEAAPQLLAALDRLNIQTIDTLIITHFHSDHLGGLSSVLKHFPLAASDKSREILVPFAPEDSEMKPTPLVEQLKKHALRIVRKGETLLKTPSLHIEVLHPKIQTGNQNEDSLVLKIVHGDVHFLLAADIGPTTQKKLVEDYGHQLKSDLLKIPHHLNDTRVFSPFLEAIRAKIAILTIGENPYQAPNSALLALYQQQIRTLFRTDQHGTITATSDGHTLHIKTERS
ncbi:MAG: MBL fold metallo-hydrolase [Nitrospirota bacterium]|nr:MBL fold metallo-hydrolase [Nitrospirota bacterium]